MNNLLEKLYLGTSLNSAETNSIFNDIFSGKYDPVALSSLLTALKMNGYSSEEIGGAASAMLHAAMPFERNREIYTGEIVGTGGDCLKTINISTLAGIICATLGLHIAKHGSSAVSSKTGASDVLSVLGYNLFADAECTRRNLEEEGFAFFFAPHYHKGMRFVTPVRKALGTSTIFNILGPLTNPAHVDYQLLGCYDADLLEIMIRALKITGVKRAMVVNGNGMDEISIFGHTNYTELFEDGHIESGILNNDNFGIKGNFTQEQLEGGSPEDNARIAREVLSGKGTEAQQFVVAANAAALLRLSGLEHNLKLGFEMALDAIRSGKGEAKLAAVCRISQLSAQP
ncbi:MAG: anthranilate phosphoribosyltransferase [Succinivibrio sp.]|nr:anthranilate phosphoribosyltransferase [Succinivibrio sp.]